MAGEQIPIHASAAGADPDSAPDSHDPTGTCPHCGRVSNFRPAGEPLPVLFSTERFSMGAAGSHPDVELRVSSLLCMGCRKGTVVVEEQWVGEHRAREGSKVGGALSWRGIHWWPPPSSTNLDEAIPLPIRQTFAEGARCFASRAPRAAAVMFGRTIEEVVRHTANDRAVAALEKNLAAALEVMVEERLLDPSIAEWAKELRLARNVGAHADSLDTVTHAEAAQLVELTRQLLIFMYEVPARLARARRK